MKFNLSLILALALSLTGCKYNAAKILAKPDSNYILEAESDACFGTCAVFDLKIDENRNLHFKGKRFCAFEGDTVLNISNADYLRLKEQLIVQGFYAMDSAYDDPYMMDAANYLLRVSDPKGKFKTKQVRARVNPPESFAVLKKEIVGLLVRHQLLD